MRLMFSKILISSLIFCNAANSTTLWTEGFEASFPPPNWIGNSVEQSATYAFTGSNSARLGASGDTLITPQLTNATTLVFWSYTTAADPDIVVEYAADPAGPWIETAESPFSGFTEQWAGQFIDLTSLNEPYIRFRKSGTGSLYIDDVTAEHNGTASNQPPMLASIGDQTIFEGCNLNFEVTADDPADGDPVTLTATNLPTGAVFTNNTFIWNQAVPAGQYAVTFTATDKDGSASETIIITVFQPPNLILSEIADPAGTGADIYRFVELYNAGTHAIDLADEGWNLCRQNNGGTWYTVPLTGTVAAAETYLIAKSRDDFFVAYGLYPQQENANVDGNGNDVYALFHDGDHASGLLIDIYGETNVDGTDTEWEYTDSRVTRTDAIADPNPTWTATEWLIDSGATPDDMTPGKHGPAPEFQGLENPFVFLGDSLSLQITAVNTTRTDIITLSSGTLPSGATFPSAIGTDSVSSTLHWNNPTAGVYTITFSAEGHAGTRTGSIKITVSNTDEIDGYFYGWNCDTIVKLKNGQFWRNTGGVGDPVDPAPRNPDVTVTNVFGTRRMLIDTITGYTTVELIDVTESTVETTFTGLHHENIYELADGTLWKQISFENINSATDPVTAWRWIDNGKTYLRFLDRNDLIIGTSQVVPSGEPENPPIVSTIDGWFYGWEKNRIFALANGEFWQQTSLESSNDTLYQPTVTLTNWLQTGTWRMSVDGKTGTINVQQLTDVTRTRVDGWFYGFGLRKILHLKNGDWWQQTSLDSTSAQRSNPEVYIWSDNGIDILEMPDEGLSIRAEPLNVTAESTITNHFSGLHYGTPYSLANGDEWLQISFENINSTVSNPAVMLWIDSNQTQLLTRDASSDRDIGSCIVVKPDADTDGDRFANLEEIIAGSDPLNKNSLFTITEALINGDGHYILNWDAIEGRIYTILWTPSLNQPFRFLADVPAPQNHWIDTEHSPETGGFYKITVRRAP